MSPERTPTGPRPDPRADSGAWDLGAPGHADVPAAPRATGYRPRCVRPPYGATNTRIATIIANRGQRQILWTVDLRDWSRPARATIVNRVLANVRPGSRILLHDGGGDRSQTVAALDILIPKLRARGYVIGLMAC